QIAFVHDSVRPADGPLLPGTVGEPDARTEIAQRPRPEIAPARAARATAGELVRTVPSRNRIPDVRAPTPQSIGDLHERRLVFPAESEVQCQARAHLPVILEEESEIFPPSA